MVFFNYALRKLNAKIVYYGPGLCGKTTNLQWIHDHFEGGQRGKMISLATEGDRTIFFDLLPIDIGTIRGMDVTLQLYTVPGQVHYNSTRQLVLRGADGVVFVADSQRTMRSSNIESFENLQENLMLQGIDLKDFPHILQFNKRDLRDLLSPEDLNENLNVFSVPIFEAIATEGIGVQESLEGIVKLVMRNLREKYEPVASASGPQAPAPMQVTGPMAFQPEEPIAEKPDPLAPDFVSQVEPAPIAEPPGPPVPVEPATFEVPQTVSPPDDETRAVGPDSGFAAFEDEDGIPTAVYEESDEQIAEYEAAVDDASFPVDEDTAADSREPEEPEVPEEPDRFEGLFTDPRDEDGTEDLPAPTYLEPPPVPDEPAQEPEVEEDLATDPEIIEDEFQAEPPDETVDDLFEAEPPSVKAYVDDVIEVIETEDEPRSETIEEPAPPDVEMPETVVAPPANDRFEDRIEAPGPFAPPPVSDDEGGIEEAEEPDAAFEIEPEPRFEPEPEPTSDPEPEPEPETSFEPEPEPTFDPGPISEPETTSESGSEHEMVHDEVRQAFGSSENLEALASLSDDQSVSDEEPVEFFEEPPEVQPIEPPPEEQVDFVDEATPATFESPAAEEIDVVPAGEPPDEALGEAPDEAPEQAVDEEAAPEVEEVVVEAPVIDESIVNEPMVEEPVADEPIVDEPMVEQPAVDEPIVEEPVVEEPVTDEPIVEEPAEPELVVSPTAFDDDPISRAEFVMVGSGDPFESDESAVVTPEVVPPGAPVVPANGAIDVSAHDNQLHLQLKGSGAIAEMGQVRALDIEVPVPGQWVGNRKVTLQLRLTLTPAEDENE